MKQHNGHNGDQGSNGGAATGPAQGASPATGAQPSTLPPRQRARRLRTLKHVKGGLAWVFRQLEAGALEANQANAMVNALRELASVMGGADVSAELAELRAIIESEKRDNA